MKDIHKEFLEALAELNQGLKEMIETYEIAFKKLKGGIKND